MVMPHVLRVTLNDMKKVRRKKFLTCKLSHQASHLDTEVTECWLFLCVNWGWAHTNKIIIMNENKTRGIKNVCEPRRQST